MMRSLSALNFIKGSMTNKYMQLDFFLNSELDPFSAK